MTLTHQLRALKRELAAKKLRATSVRADPRDAHEAAVSADEIQRKIEALTAAHALNVKVAGECERMAKELAETKYQSIERETAIRRLREAAMWLEREAGQ